MAEPPNEPKGYNGPAGSWNDPRLEAVGVCHICKHRTNDFPPRCKAYPELIPVSILVGDVSHSVPQPGDHGIQFELKGGVHL